MKKLLLLLGIVLSQWAYSQVLTVESVEQLSIPEGDVKVAGISADGQHILLTTFTNEGLRMWDRATGQTTIISQAAGAGYNASVSADGQMVTYREKRMRKDHTTEISLRRVNLAKNKTQTLQRPTRSTRDLIRAEQMADQRPIASISDGQLMITLGGQTTQLSPLGSDKSYLWPSVSPNGKQVLFYLAGRGAYVCDLTGGNVRFVGHHMRAPKWYNDAIIIGMNDRDNGEITISSEIVAMTLDGTAQVLTSGINAMYPYTANGAIVCSGFQGETYLITVK